MAPARVFAAMMTTVGQCMPEVSQRNEINNRWMYWSNLISKQLSTRPSRYCMMRVPSGTWTINHIPQSTVECDYLSTAHLFGTTIFQHHHVYIYIYIYRYIYIYWRIQNISLVSKARVTKNPFVSFILLGSSVKVHEPLFINRDQLRLWIMANIDN